MENKYTSLELSKKLKEAGCKLESEYGWVNWRNHQHHKETKTILVNYNTEKNKYCGVYDYVLPLCPAYDILNDICCKYAKEFFGEEKVNYPYNFSKWTQNTFEEKLEHHKKLTEKNKESLRKEALTTLRTNNKDDDVCKIHMYTKESQYASMAMASFIEHLARISPVYKYQIYSQVIQDLMQQGRKEEAEAYAWEHCLFNPENKKTEEKKCKTKK